MSDLLRIEKKNLTVATPTNENLTVKSQDVIQSASLHSSKSEIEAAL